MNRKKSSPGSPAAGEKATTCGLIIDACLLCALVAAAFFANVATLLAVTVFGALLLCRSVAGFILSRQWNTGVLSHLEFGAGKLEQAWNLMIGGVMAGCGLWMVNLMFDLIATGESLAPPRDFAIAAAVIALFTLRSGLALFSVLHLIDNRSSSADHAEWRSRLLRFASLIIVQMTITVAAFTEDPIIALLADALGTIFVALLLTAGGARLFVLAVSDLIDYPLNPSDQAHLSSLIRDAGIEERELLDLRARRSGRHVFVELTIDPGQGASFAEARRRMIRLRQDLTEGMDDLDVAIKLRTPAV